jgi:glutamate-1-semialdehyde 2,1-aminomutase
MDHTRNKEIYSRACKSLAGGLLSNFKKEKGSQPVYVKSVDGCKITDFDGNVYRDFALSMGPAILGHSNERYKQALKDQIDRLYTTEFGMVQIEAAEKIKQCIPGLDIIRFAVSGSEADAQAIRVARAYTKKNMYVRFNGQYHGGLDYVIGGIVNDPDNPVISHGELDYDVYSQFCTTQGRATHALDDCFMIEFNDLPAMRELFQKYGDNIAAVIMEPVAININGCVAEPGYLEGVRALCDKHNVVLIFDEVITGFRIGLGGCAEFYGVKPDLWTFAKALTGGMPGSVYGGKKVIMDTITDTKVLAAGTFNGHPVTCAGIINVIEQLSENDGEAFKKIRRFGGLIKEGMEANAKKYNIPFILQGFSGALVPVFTEKAKIINHQDALENANHVLLGMFTGKMKNLGVLNTMRFCPSLAHTEEDIEFAINASDVAFKELAEMFAE